MLHLVWDRANDGTLMAKGKGRGPSCQRHKSKNAGISGKKPSCVPMGEPFRPKTAVLKRL